jgi:SAM-dependent methyltransferase
VNIASPVYAADRVWHRYRQRPDSVYAVARATGQTVESRLKYLEWLTGYMRDQGIEAHAVTSLAGTELQKLRNPGGSWWSRRSLKAAAKALLQAVLPLRLHARAVAWWRKQPLSPPPGRVDFGDFRRLSPFSRRWGKDRLGIPIDRYYIDRFLQANAGDIRGRVMEVGDSTYTRRFGSDAVVQIDILHTVAGDPSATLVGDLCTGDGLPTKAFDCVILTQVLHVLPDPAAAVRTLQRILKPGGVVLATVPGISQVSRWDTDRWGDYWRCTEMAVRHLFSPVFPPDETTLSSHGNVLVAAAFLYGLADSELREDELDHVDADYPLMLTVRAALPSAKAGRPS